MKGLHFSKRIFKEILRDPLTLFFGALFPAILIVLLSVIQKNIPVSLFEAQSLVPGVSIFGLSFMTLFSATIISSDREGGYLDRLYATPMKSRDFIIGYTLPLVPISLLQTVISYLVGMCFGLSLSLNMLYSLITIIPVSIFFISLGLIFGSILTQKQVGGICGALLTNLSAWLSGIWFDLELVGGAFKKIAELLPFYHAVKVQRLIFAEGFSGVDASLIIVLIYAALSLLFAVLLFLRQMKKR
jgi:ABC-2 type transport system permease protein